MLAQKIALNTFWQILGKIISIIIGIAVIVMLTRFLGQVGFGGFTTVTAYLQFFGIIVDFGLTIVGAQMLALTIWPQEKIFNNVISLKIITALIIFGLATALAWLTNYPLIIKLAISLASLSFILNAIQQVFVGWYQKNLIIAKLAIAEIISKIILFIGIIITILIKGDLFMLMIVLIAASLTYLYFTIYFLHHTYQPRLAFDWEIWQEIIRRSWPIALSIIFNLIYLKADTIILSLTRSQAEVGIYGASFRILEVLITFPMMLLGLLLPQLTKAWLEKNESYWQLMYQKTYDLINIIVWPLALGGILIATDIITLIAGKDFIASAAILKILLLALIAIFLGTLFGHLIVSLNKQRESIWVFALTAIIALTLYLVFIPQFGFWAAGIITLLAEMLITLLTFILVSKMSKFYPRQKYASIAIFGATLMFIILKNLALDWWLTIFLGFFIYAAIILLCLRKTPKSFINHFHY